MKFAAVLLLLTPILAPDKAKIVLHTPKSACVGELVRFDASESVADEFRWLLIPDSVDFEVYAGGKKAVFSARTPGDYRFVLAVAKGGTVDVVSFVVHVGSPLTPSDASLAHWVPYWAYGLQLKGGAKLAANFRKVASELPATPQEWIKRTKELNKASGVDLEAWGPVLDKIGAACSKRAEAGTLKTPEQHRALWLEIAEGLDATT